MLFSHGRRLDDPHKRSHFAPYQSKATTYLKIRFLRIRNYFAIVQFFDCKTQEQHPKPIQFSNHPKHATSPCIRVYRQPYKIRQNEQPSSKKEVLFNTFINLVAKNHKQQHSVTFYATKLFITPKYLTRVIEEISHKPAKRWIDEYIALEAKMMLRSTSKTIQEISDELSFPDMSFFGKFFKRVVGMSPRSYREK